MSGPTLSNRLDRLEAFRNHFEPDDSASVIELLDHLDTIRFSDTASLIRFHETVLFLRAFPPSPAVVRTTEGILRRFHRKVATLRKNDLAAFDTFEFSGVAGTQMEDTLSFDVANWLTQRLPGKVEIAWENYDPGRELGNSGPRFMPLLEDDALVEADTPWRAWLEAAAGGKGSGSGIKAASWLLQRFARLPLPPAQKAELYESLRVPLRWSLGNSSITRTRNWRPVRTFFYHDTPLIARSQVSLAAELARRPPQLTRLSRRQGEEVVDLIREVMLVRYRELYGTTLGDHRTVVKAEVGRGVQIYLWNLPPDRRLPLRAYVAGLTLKNGVPINYIEAIGLCEWMEVGFNTFYTFRGGEAGWIYAQVLRCLCHRMHTTCISVYPYQLGHDNEEAIESGAFWFYRKLGFRPGRSELERLALAEEAKIAANPNYRTSARTLRRLAAGHVFYELPGHPTQAWDTFSTRNISLCVNRRMARDFAGDAARMREQARRALERALGVSTSSWATPARSSFENFALLLTQPLALRGWTKQEKDSLVAIIRAKTKPDEMLYLRGTQRHARLRQALLALGS